MARLFVRTLVGFFALTLFTTALLAGPAPAGNEPMASSVANVGSGTRLALVCILAAGGMLYLFRPRSRVITPKKSD